MLKLFLIRCLAVSALGALLGGCAAPFNDPYYDGPDIYPAPDSGPRAYPSAPPHPYDWRRPQYPKPYYEREEAREREREREHERLQKIEHERTLQKRREYNERERHREREAQRDHEQRQEKLRQQRERLRETTQPPAPDRRNSRNTDSTHNEGRFQNDERFRDQTPRLQER